MRSTNILVLVTVLVLALVVPTDAYARRGFRTFSGSGRRVNGTALGAAALVGFALGRATQPRYGYARPVYASYPAYSYVQTTYPVVQQVVVAQPMVQRVVVVDPYLHSDGYRYGGGVWNNYNPSAYAGMDDGICNNSSNVTYRVRGTGGVRTTQRFGPGLTDNSTYRAGGGGVRYSGSTGITDNRPYTMGGGFVRNERMNYYDASGGRGVNNGGGQNGRGQ